MLLIKNGRLIDPAQNLDERLDLFVQNGVIAQIAADIDPNTITGVSGGKRNGLRIVDATAKIVAPGFLDMHTHLREPGYESKETIATGCNAAAAGGYTAIACMPNTDPVNDNPVVTKYIQATAKEQGCVRVYPIGAITRGSLGDSLTDIGALKEAGVVAVSDDGEPIMSAEIMRRALEYVKGFSLPIIAHCEEKSLVQDGVMHESAVSTRLGLPGIPAAAEDVMVARDVILAEMTGSRVHIAHVSTAGAVGIIRQAKARGVSVTGEAAPHHFTLTDEAVRTFDTNTRVNPPLRSAHDRDRIREGLKDGTLEVIATDHAPHTSSDKDTEYSFAANGIAGLETAVSLTLNELVHTGFITINQAIALLSTNPAKLLAVPGGTLRKGTVADITLLDLEREFTVDPTQFKSKSQNTPFNGWVLRGKPIMTIVGGTVVWEST